MFDLKISGIVEAERWVNVSRWPTHVISLINPANELPFSVKNHHIGYMHDVASQVDPSWVLPNESHLEEALKFTENLKTGDKLLVHCFQGISRSTSIAIAALIQHGMNYKDAYYHVANIRNILLPNILFTEMTDRRFGLNGDLVRLVASERMDRLRKKFGEEAIDNDHESLVAMKAILEKLNKVN